MVSRELRLLSHPTHNAHREFPRIRGPKSRPQNTIILIIGTPKKGPEFLKTPTSVGPASMVRHTIMTTLGCGLYGWSHLSTCSAHILCEVPAVSLLTVVWMVRYGDPSVLLSVFRDFARNCKQQS